MNEIADQPPRIGILWRDDRSTESPTPRADRKLGALFEAFSVLDVEIVLVPFADDAIEEVKAELLSCDGVLVWINPIQDGANRANVDLVLREVSAAGVFVSTDPEVILRLGTKEVLVRTRDIGWGSDAELYRTFGEFRRRFPKRLADHGRLVLKQGRGNGGDGVWKVKVLGGAESEVSTDTPVRVQDAQTRDGSSETMNLGAFMDRCEGYFTWSGLLVDQVFQERLADGMLRCYFTHDRVVGFCRQWPKGLLDFDPDDQAPVLPTVMEGPDTASYQPLRLLAEKEWVPQMTEVLGIATTSLPVIWDADFLYGPKTSSGADTYVLCEINVSAVWPFPPMAATAVAEAALARTLEARAARTYRATT